MGEQPRSEPNDLSSTVEGDPLKRPAEDESTELSKPTDDQRRLPPEMPELRVEETRSPTNYQELSSPCFSLPSNDEDYIRTDSALRDNQYDSDSVSLSELMSTDHSPLPVPTEPIQVSERPSGPASEIDRKAADFAKEAETPTMKSAAAVDGIRPVEAALLGVAPPSLAEENKPAQTAYNQPSSQKVDFSLAQSISDISDAEDMPNVKSSRESVHFTSMDGTIVKIYHECGVYKRNICTQIDNVRVCCTADGEYYRGVKEETPQMKWLILKERCIGTSPYDPRKEDISEVDTPVSLSAATSYGSNMNLLDGGLRNDEKISRIIEALKGLDNGNQSNVSTVASIIEALKAVRGGILSAELFLSRLGSGMGTIIEKLQEKQ